MRERAYPSIGRSAHRDTASRQRERAGAGPPPAPPGRSLRLRSPEGPPAPAPCHPHASTGGPWAPGGLPSPSGPSAGSRTEPEPEGGDDRLLPAP